MKQGQDRLMAQFGLSVPSRKGLAPGYVDKDGGLLADAPSDAKKLLDPDTLVLASYEGDDDDRERVDWQSFADRLAAATGKQVHLRTYENTADQVAEIKAGKIHIVALHSADTPYVVNNAGFIPVAVLGTEQGASGNHLDIAVRPDSPIKSLADLRGKRLTCTRPTRSPAIAPPSPCWPRKGACVPTSTTWSTSRWARSVRFAGWSKASSRWPRCPTTSCKACWPRERSNPNDYRLIYESQVIPRPDDRPHLTTCSPSWRKRSPRRRSTSTMPAPKATRRRPPADAVLPDRLSGGVLNSSARSTIRSIPASARRPTRARRPERPHPWARGSWPRRPCDRRSTGSPR